MKYLGLQNISTQKFLLHNVIENTFFDTLNDFLPSNKKLDDQDMSERTLQLFEQLRIFNMIMDRVRFMFRLM